jgi:hypothetical protein
MQESGNLLTLIFAGEMMARKEGVLWVDRYLIKIVSNHKGELLFIGRFI